ncbi:hypothetical protein [Phreatobacter aquaticus]|uniref:hypothetical protein n=1 Tax=Phreatobacter aquaticus TaxID=2570229 RepID=UPI00143D7424|nr:hypothetical protein [Phreatobacter aquaticus]
MTTLSAGAAALSGASIYSGFGQSAGLPADLLFIAFGGCILHLILSFLATNEA